MSSSTTQQQELVLSTEVNEDEMEGIEVALVHDGCQSHLEVRLIRWGPGVGWYVEKRITLSPARSKALRHSLGMGEALAASWVETDLAFSAARSPRRSANTNSYPEK